jgi:hypothetical protein
MAINVATAVSLKEACIRELLKVKTQKKSVGTVIQLQIMTRDGIPAIGVVLPALPCKVTVLVL